MCFNEEARDTEESLSQPKLGRVLHTYIPIHLVFRNGARQIYPHLHYAARSVHAHRRILAYTCFVLHLPLHGPGYLPASSVVKASSQAMLSSPSLASRWPYLTPVPSIHACPLHWSLCPRSGLGGRLGCLTLRFVLVMMLVRSSCKQKSRCQGLKVRPATQQQQRHTNLDLVGRQRGSVKGPLIWKLWKWHCYRSRVPMSARLACCADDAPRRHPLPARSHLTQPWIF